MTRSSVEMLTTSPITTELSVVLPSAPASTTVWQYLHWSATGESAMRGGCTTRDDAMASPAVSGSLIVSSSAPVCFIWARNSKVDVLAEPAGALYANRLTFCVSQTSRPVPCREQRAIGGPLGARQERGRMKLHWSPRSPFVRKVMITAHELGLLDRLNCVRTVAATTKPHAELMRDNPLSKIPTLVLDGGTVIYDSPVICEYLDRLPGKATLFPTSPPERMTALRRQALGDGFLDFLLLWRNELERQHPSQVHLASYAERRRVTLLALDSEAEALASSPFSIGHIAIGCALSYLDFRFATDDWRGGHPRIAAWHATFAKRPSVLATEPIDDR